MTLAEFYDELEKHDWYHMMSDSHAVWQAGVRSLERLQELAKETPVHQGLLDAYQAYIRGRIQGKRVSKPKRPNKPKR